ncbi:MAG: hypothetical protein AB7I33_02860 [Gemmatimonadales bacterium]
MRYRLLGAGVVLLGIVACGGVNGVSGLPPDGTNPDPYPYATWGRIHVAVNTIGDIAPGTEYTVSISNGRKTLLEPNDSVTFQTTRTGLHEVALNGIPRWCVVNDGDYRQIQVHQSETVPVQFSITCANGL